MGRTPLHPLPPEEAGQWGLEALNVHEHRRRGGPTRSGRISSGGSWPSRWLARRSAQARISAELAREKWGGLRISEHAVWRLLVRLGLNTRAKRLGVGRASPRSRRSRPLARPRFTRRPNGRTLSTIASAMTLGRCAGSIDAPPRTGSRSTTTSRARRTPRGSAEAMVAAASCTLLATAGRGA
jgi:hypothetical protein